MSGDEGSTNWSKRALDTFDNDMSFNGGSFNCEKKFSSSSGCGLSCFEGGSLYMSFDRVALFLENGKGDGGSSDWKNK